MSKTSLKTTLENLRNNIGKILMNMLLIPHDRWDSYFLREIKTCWGKQCNLLGDISIIEPFQVLNFDKVGSSVGVTTKEKILTPPGDV